MKYLPVYYSVVFEEKPEWGNPPQFVFRSVIGLALRRLTCALKLQQSCSGCMLNESCVYSVFFETNINKEISSLPGRNKAVHPFVFDIESVSENDAVVKITFIGKAVNYIPYVNLALEKAGENGIGRNRAKFSIASITTYAGVFSSSIREIEKLCLSWPGETGRPKSLTLLTPTRIKESGKYLSTVTLNSLLINMHRRIAVLLDLFEDESDNLSNAELNEIDSLPVEQKWEEKTYYSSRQKTRMQLGGVTGKIKIEGEVPSFERNLIEAMELFHVGKNISFGLGKIKVDY